MVLTWEAAKTLMWGNHETVMQLEGVDQQHTPSSHLTHRDCQHPDPMPLSEDVDHSLQVSVPDAKSYPCSQ